MTLKDFIIEKAEERAEAWKNSQKFSINDITFLAIEENGVKVDGAEQLAQILGCEFETIVDEHIRNGYAIVTRKFKYNGTPFFQTSYEKVSKNADV